MGWIGQLIERRRQGLLLKEIAALRSEPLPSGLESAIIETSRVIPPKTLPGLKRSLYAPVVLIFARQLADANARLGSNYWSSGGGRNVGIHILQAQGRARVVLVDVMNRRPTVRRPLVETVGALDRLIDAQRADAADEDGYGLGTLHELRRDLAELALREGGSRN